MSNIELKIIPRECRKTLRHFNTLLNNYTIVYIIVIICLPVSEWKMTEGMRLRPIDGLARRHGDFAGAGAITPLLRYVVHVGIQFSRAPILNVVVQDAGFVLHAVISEWIIDF